MVNKIKINRAPVLTLWAAVVAERLGYNHDEALTFGKAVAGLNAQSKGQRLGIFSPAEKELDEKQGKKERQAGESLMVEVVGRLVPAVQTEQGLRATVNGEAMDPNSVERYLEKKFGENLAEVRSALEELAQAYAPGDLKQHAFSLYTQFRPEIPEGVQGWGAAGVLDLEKIGRLAKKG